MKKLIILISVFFFCALLLYPQKIDFSKFTPEDTVNFVSERMTRFYEPTTGSVTEDDGCYDFHFRLRKKLADMDELYEYMNSLVVYVGEITSKTSWPSNIVLVYFKEKPFCWIYTKDCRKAINLMANVRYDFIVNHLHYEFK